MKKNAAACLVVLGMLFLVTIPFFLTLHTIPEQRPLVPVASNPSPYGYTWSLSIFLVPVVVLLAWFLRQKEYAAQRKAFWVTVVLMASLGMILDIFFGLSFFTFENTRATLGIHFWGYDFSKGWLKTIPIEEVGFYAFGCLAILLVYIWGNEFWFRAYKVSELPPYSKRFRDLVCFHPDSAIVGVAIFALAWIIKKYWPTAYHPGFPGYFLFMVVVAITPSILFFPIAAPFINWRAYSFSLFATLLASLFWEGAIALPYQWWGYVPTQMIGIFLNGLSGLPIEEPILWVSASWAITIVYETIHIFLRMRLQDVEALLEGESFPSVRKARENVPVA